MIYLLIFVLLVLLELAYFCVADRFNIIDKPNLRSSHTSIVLRGGGIIFLFGAWLFFSFFGFQYPWFILGLSLVGLVSFIDDIHSLPDSVRLVIQFVAMGLMFYQFGILNPNDWWIVLVALIVCVGIINAYNHGRHQRHHRRILNIRIIATHLSEHADPLHRHALSLCCRLEPSGVLFLQLP